MSQNQYLEESFPKPVQKTGSQHNAVNSEKIVHVVAACFLGPRKIMKKGVGCFFNKMDAFSNVLDAFSNVLDAFSNDSNRNPISTTVLILPLRLCYRLVNIPKNIIGGFFGLSQNTGEIVQNI